MSERLGIAGSGAIALRPRAAVAAEHGQVVALGARSDARRPRASSACREARRAERGNVRSPRPRRARATRPSWSRRSSRTPTPRRALLRAARRRCCADGRDPRDDDSSLSVARARRGQRAPRPLRRPARLQPGRRRWSWSSSPSRPRPTPRHASARARPVRGARQDRGRGPRHARLRRQPAAVPVPVRRRAAARAHRPGAARRSTPA